jgi:hypothetical protein
MWTAAYQWVTQNVPVLQSEADDCTQYFVSSAQVNAPITPKLLKKFQRRAGKWSSFDDFKVGRTEIWQMSASSTSVTCSCPVFVKRRQCKHALDMRIRCKEIEVPIEAKNIPLGQKSKRGRPSKAAKALIIQ